MRNKKRDKITPIFQWGGIQLKFIIIFSFVLIILLVHILQVVEASTTIQLQDADTKNLEDTYSRTGDTSDNSAEKLRIGRYGDTYSPYAGWIKFNLSVVPSGQQIDEAILALYHYYEEAGSHVGENYSVYEVDNQTWTENTCIDTDANCPTPGSLINTTSPSGADGTSYWQFFTVTSWVSLEYDSNKGNVSFMINRTYNSSTGDYCQFYSKEETSATIRPYLNITYSEAIGALTVHLTSPANNTFVSNNTITPTSSQVFSCSINDEGGVANLTLYIWNSTDNNIHTNTTNLTGTSNSTNFTYNFPYYDTFKWNCLGYNLSGSSNWSAEGNYTITYTNNLIDCTNINQSGIYYLERDILDSSTSYCMNISANNVTLDCQNNQIDGEDSADYGIWIYRSSGTDTNITIRNCDVTDWDTEGIYMSLADNITLENLNVSSNPGNGIHLFSSDGNTLNNLTVYGNRNRGIYIDYSDNNLITNTTVKSNGVPAQTPNSNGLMISNSRNTELINLNLTNNSNYDFHIFGISGSNPCNTKIENVTVSGNKPLAYYNYSINLQNQEFAHLILCNAGGSNLTNITITSYGEIENNGLLVEFSDNVNLTDLNISNVYRGIFFYMSNNGTITNSKTNSNRHGIWLENTENTLLSNITSNSNSEWGFHYEVDVKNVTVENAVSMYNQEGFSIYPSNYYNIIKNSTISSNTYYGMYISNGNGTIKDNVIENNTLYGMYTITLGGQGAWNIYNNLFNNSENVYITSNLTNYWNTTKQTGTRIYSSGTEIGGNYWANSSGTGYSDTCADADTDGFCDVAYNISAANNTDYLPLSDEYSNTAPTVNLTSPANNTGDNDGNLTFFYNVSDVDSNIANCSLIINSILNQTDTLITKDITQNFTLNNLAVGTYNWSVNCTDSNNGEAESETRKFSVVLSTKFSGDTTDLSQVNISNITNLIIDQPSYGKINFSESVDLSSRADFNTNVNISNNRIEINSTALPILNKSAILYLYNLTFSNPRILRNSLVCPSSICTKISYSAGTLMFNVTQFSVYSAEEMPTTSPSGSGGDCSKRLEIIAPSEVNITQGETKQINITLKSTGSCTLNNINVSLDVPVGWQSASEIISKLHINKNQTVSLNIPPLKSVLGNYIITVKADSIGLHKSKLITVWVTKEAKAITPETRLSQHKLVEKIKEVGWTYIVVLIIFIAVVLILWKKGIFRNRIRKRK